MLGFIREQKRYDAGKAKTAHAERMPDGEGIQQPAIEMLKHVKDSCECFLDFNVREPAC